MPYINEADFRKRLRDDLFGCFVFFGEEDYLKAWCIKAAREQICPDEGLACFNDITIDFPDFSVDALADALAAPPMMCERKLVTLKAFNFSAVKPTDVDAVISLLGQYREDTGNLLLISVIPDGLDVGYLPKRPSALFKRLMDVCTPVQFETSTPAKLQAWAARHFKHENIDASDAAVRFLIEYCGRSMYSLSSEIAKLCAYLHSHGRSEVTADDIRYVTVPEEECDTFSLSNAIMANDRAGALAVLGVMKFRQVKPEYALFEIVNLYCNLYQTKALMTAGVGQADIARILSQGNKKVHEYTVGLYMKTVARLPEEALVRAVTLCQDADLGMKSYGKRDYEQIEKLICLL